MSTKKTEIKGKKFVRKQEPLTSVKLDPTGYLGEAQTSARMVSRTGEAGTNAASNLQALPCVSWMDYEKFAKYQMSLNDARNNIATLLSVVGLANRLTEKELEAQALGLVQKAMVDLDKKYTEIYG